MNRCSTGIRLLYLTPLRALSRDLALAIREPIDAMGWPLRVGIRNGDSSSSERSKLKITTADSCHDAGILTLLLSNPKAEELFGALDTVILDEWHELMGSKRGSQSELCLSWLRQQRPRICRPGRSAPPSATSNRLHVMPLAPKPSCRSWGCTCPQHPDPQHLAGVHRRISGPAISDCACTRSWWRGSIQGHQHPAVHQHPQPVGAMAPVPALRLPGDGRRPGPAPQRHRPQ